MGFVVCVSGGVDLDLAVWASAGTRRSGLRVQVLTGGAGLVWGV